MQAQQHTHRCHLHDEQYHGRLSISLLITLVYGEVVVVELVLLLAGIWYISNITEPLC